MTHTNAIAHDIARDVLSVIEQFDRHVQVLAVVEFFRTPKRQHYTSDDLGSDLHLMRRKSTKKPSDLSVNKQIYTGRR